MQAITNDPIVFLSAARTPMGGFLGELSGLQATELGSAAIRAAIAKSGIDPQTIDELMFGCVLPAGLGQAPARQAALGAGLPQSTVCTTVNKVCGSGMRAVMSMHDTLAVGAASLVVAGGMESMSNAPYLLARARAGYRIGHGTVYDHMMLDGLEDAYERGRSMGTFGEDCARQYNFTRQMQDQFAMESVSWAKRATETGAFKEEITPVDVTSRKGTVRIETDEGPRTIALEKIPTLKPAFAKDGTVTAASSSSISDGAAALVMCRMSTAERLGKKPLARMVGHAGVAQQPSLFTTAPIGAIQKLLGENKWQVSDVDLWEINEAFAVVAMAALHDLKIARDQLNVNGGACALGHPIGASGARIVVTLIHALKQRGLKRGVASLCIG
ncbi:MAG: acetyl-CoA C-acyltransferase, partial [Burkholderiaceae bacterium]|nr:acetyl-CoA C-acyltransferase [Burkholderiaceae bacterium]